MSIPLLTREGRRARPAIGGRVGRRAAAVLLGLVAAAAIAGPALGHAELVSSDPADKAQLQSPPTGITMTFSETLDGSKSSFKLLGPDGSTIGTGGMTAAKEMSLTGLTLAPGAYTIKWTSASAQDGDIARGEVSFTVLAAAASPSASASAPASAGAPSPSAAPTQAASAPPAPTPSPSAAPQETASTGSGVLVPIIVALLIVAGIGAWVLRRSRAA